MAAKLQRLDVSVLGRPVGELRLNAAAGDPAPYRFTYRAGLPDEASAALNMPTAERDYATADIPAPFEQSLPEMNLAIFPTAIWKYVARDRMGLLWASSRRRIGRLRFESAELQEKQPPAVTLSSSDLKSVRNGDALFLDTVRALQDIPGVSGIQPKVFVSVSEPGRPTPRKRGAPRSRTNESASTNLRSVNTDTHILKANHPDYVGATVVESLCLDVAEATGLPTPSRTLSGDGRLLAVRRFDLGPRGQSRGFDEIGALLGRTAEHKYDGTLEEVARTVREFAGARQSVESLRRLFILCLLNNVLRNGDAHLKNFGLLYDAPADASLSPVYDVLTTRCFERLRNDAPALSLEGRNQWDDYAALLRFGQAHCLLGRADMRQAMARVAETVESFLPKIMEARDRYPCAAATLWVMRAEWLGSIGILRRHL